MKTTRPAAQGRGAYRQDDRRGKGKKVHRWQFLLRWRWLQARIRQDHEEQSLVLASA